MKTVGCSQPTEIIEEIRAPVPLSSKYTFSDNSFKEHAMSVRKNTIEMLDYAADNNAHDDVLVALSHWFSEYEIAKFWEDYKHENGLEEYEEEEEDEEE
ncbi:MAG: hypothetical protein ACO37F_13830 [Pirellulales bacterium]